jgi:dihydrofolate reductase
MRRIGLHMYVTVDGRAGFVRYPGWDDLVPDVKRDFADMWTHHYATTDTIILGRCTYEASAAFWPMANRRPGEPKWFVDHRRLMDRCTKVVFLHDLKEGS